MRLHTTINRFLITLAVIGLALPVYAGSADNAQGRSPTPESIQASYDELDYQHAVQAYLWSIPSMYMYSLRKSLVDTFGATPNKNVPLWADLMDNETRAMLKNGTRFPNIDSYRQLKTNEDGSINLYFGPQAPEGYESNWVKTVSGKDWFAMMRFYGPEQPYFDKSWQLNDFEKME